MFYVSGLVKYDPMRASSYLPLPKELKAKKACLNIQNYDKHYHHDRCKTSREFIIINTGEKSHYVLVKDLSRMVSSKTYFCQYCLHGCTSEEVLKNHLERSKSFTTQYNIMYHVGAAST